jgi:adenosylcobinamide-GDP ribazoletransferase
MHTFLRRLCVTLSYVTCLPSSNWLAHADEKPDFTGLAKYLTTAGVMIGGSLFIVATMCTKCNTPPMVQAVILTWLWIALTNGLHIDGLMDTADGIFSHKEPATILKIMQDSRVGNFGVLAGLFVITVKICCLASLPSKGIAAVLFLCPAWARWCETFAIGAFPYAREFGMGKIWHDTMKFPDDLLIASILPLLFTIYFALRHPLLSLSIAFFTCVFGILASYFLARKVGGQTGDTYGAVLEFSEAAGLLVSTLVYFNFLSWQ